MTINTLVANGTELIACGEYDGIYHSTDDGVTWSIADSGLITTYVNTLLVDSNNIYAGTYGYNAGVFLSTNNLVSWQPANIGLPYASISTLYLNGNNLIAGGLSNELFITNDNGTNWAVSNTGLPQNARVTSIAADSTKLYAGTKSEGVYYSSDNGQTWAISNSSGPRPTSVDVVTTFGGALFAGTSPGKNYRSVDGGITWASINNGIPSMYYEVHDYASIGSRLFAGTDFGVWYTDDLGDNWTFAGNGGNEVWSLLSVGSRLIAGHLLFKGIYTSTDSGITWNHVSGIIGNANVYSLEQYGSITFAGTDNPAVYYSLDTGQTWNQIPGLLDCEDVYSVKAVGSNLFAATDNGVYINSTFLNLTNIQEQNSFLLTVYPNPLSSNSKQLTVYVGNQTGNIQLEIINSLGQKVFTESGIISNQKSYQIENLEPGIYFLVAKLNGKGINQKIMVQ